MMTPPGWEQVALESVVEATQQRDPRNDATTLFTYVDVSSVDSACLAIAHPTLVRGSDAPSRARKVLSANDTIFATVRPSLKRIALVPQALHGAIGSTAFCVLRPLLERVDPMFLFCSVSSDRFVQRVSELQRGVAYPAVSDGDVRRQTIPLPPLPEQRAIARALKAVQAARDARRRELELERERKAALMEHLFTKGTRGEPTKMTDIGEMPESWEVRRVQDIAAVRGGKRLPKGASFCDAVTAHPYIRVVDLRDGSVSLGGLRYVDETTHATIAQYTIGKRDVYISIAGTIGSVGTVPAILDGANLTENAAKLVVAQADQLDYRFLAAWLGGGSAQSQIASLTMKTSQPKLALSRIRTILVPLPDLDEQERVVGALDAVVARVDALVREATLLDELFKALLQELMTGRLSAVGLIEGGTAEPNGGE